MNEAKILLRIAFFAAAFVTGVVVATWFVQDTFAAKPPAPPGQGECAHGNSLKPCKEDPQPERGKECDEHGKKGGVNEDHCKGQEPPVTTTETTETTPTTPEPPVTTPDPEKPGTPDEPGRPEPPVVEPGAGSPPVTPKSLEDELKKQANKNNPSGVTGGHVQQSDELPYTGFPAWLAVLLGVTSVGGGLYLRRR